MSSTLEELQTITDVKFERLVAGYLRQTVPVLTELIATGINEQGKPIPSPVDAIVHVSGPPETCVAVACTTTSLSDLHGKWFGKPSKIGDIPKAAATFQSWRAAHPSITCVLYLATNRMLRGDLALYQKAISDGQALGIQVRIVEGSILGDFLDTHPEGQYLRELFLGIGADRVSISMLQSIATTSLQEHRHLFSLGAQDHQVVIDRALQPHLLALLDKSPGGLVGIEGPSGVGKSTLARHIGEQINADGGIAFWLAADLIEPGVPLATLFSRLLRRFQPSLRAQAGQDALHLCASAGVELLVLVDDINRLAAPRQVLRSVESWVAGIQGSAKEAPVPERLRLRLIVPLWPGQLGHAHTGMNSQRTQWQTVRLANYSLQEQRTLAEALSKVRQTAVAPVFQALSGDPFLCGLAANEPGLTISGNRLDLIRRILERALNQVAVAAVEQMADGATVNEFVLAVEALISLMLTKGQPEPALATIRVCLDRRTVSLLLGLARTEQLGQLEDLCGADIWRWKHDRLRDLLVGRWLAKHAIGGAEQPARGTVDGWLADPGLAEAWALTLVFLPTVTDRRVTLSRLADLSPLALVHSVRLALVPEELQEQSRLQAGLQRALTPAEDQGMQYVATQQDYLLRELSQIGDPLVPTVTQQLGDDFFVLLARTRNGDVVAALKCLGGFVAGGNFLPWLHAPDVEQAIEGFSLAYPGTADDLGQTLVAAQPGVPFATALLLAGYIAWPVLANALAVAWAALDQEARTEILPYGVWAFSRCGEPQASLEEALLLAQHLSDEGRVDGNAHYPSDRQSYFLEPLRALHRWPVPSTSVATWVHVAENCAPLTRSLQYILGGMDDPMAMAAHVRWAGQVAGNNWLAFNSINDANSAVRGDTRAQLWQLVLQDDHQPTRRVAFRFWRANATRTDLPLLHRLARTDPLFDSALGVRVELGDATATEALIERMHTDPQRWCTLCAPLYDQPGVAAALLDQFEAAMEEPVLGPTWIAQYLPHDGVRALVTRHRDLLLRTPDTWTSLWRSGVPEALELVCRAIATAQPEDLRFFFMKTSNIPFLVSQYMLDALLPYLDRFDQRELRYLADITLFSNLISWAEEHLPETMAAFPHYRIRTAPGIVEALDAAVAHVPDGPRAVYSTIEFHWLLEQGNSSVDAISILRTWLGPSPSHGMLVVAAMVLEARGTGADLDWWLQLEPTHPDTHAVWSCLHWLLMRRRWHDSGADQAASSKR